MLFSTAELLTAIASGRGKSNPKPWGIEYEFTFMTAAGELTVKMLRVNPGARTSLQHHMYKTEIMILLEGHGNLELDGLFYRADDGAVKEGITIFPGHVHRVSGPLLYLEFADRNDPDDIVRHQDDYGRNDT